MIQIYHNSRCGKSRNCLAQIQYSKKKFEVINYLVNPPTYDELSSIIKKLDKNPTELVRKKEKLWIENFKDKKFNDEETIAILISNPILI